MLQPENPLGFPIPSTQYNELLIIKQLFCYHYILPINDKVNLNKIVKNGKATVLNNLYTITLVVEKRQNLE